LAVDLAKPPEQNRIMTLKNLGFKNLAQLAELVRVVCAAHLFQHVG
jgi:hypothetical protein